MICRASSKLNGPRKPFQAIYYSTDTGKIVAFDRTKLFSSKLSPAKPGGTPLMKHIATSIATRGPMSVASWMREVLTNPIHGYYMNRDVFGKEGDFITSPEISQMFGEMIGVWCVEMWQRLGQPSNFKIVELGPGRGTLMKDILRTISCFPGCKEKTSLYLIEISPHLRKLQAQALGLEYPDHSTSIGEKTGLKEEIEKRKGMWEWEGNPSVIKNTFLEREDGLKVSWCQNLSDVPEGPILIIAHEFFDALPVHQFQFTENGWRERLVDNNDDPESSKHFKFVISPTPTVASTGLMKKSYYPDLPTGPVQDENTAIGMSIESSAIALATAQDIGMHLSNNKGAALIIDYGHNRPSAFSLRAIKEHKLLDMGQILEQPGEADLSCDVDFSVIARLAKLMRTKSDENPKIETYGPVTQEHFLTEMGIDLRLAKLLALAEDEKKAQYLTESFTRITSPEEMGRIYKCMAIATKDLITPPGFQYIPVSKSSE